MELLCTARLGDEFESMLWEESKICPEDPVADDAMRLVCGPRAWYDPPGSICSRPEISFRCSFLFLEFHFSH